jgi:micrococcal nuclease
MSRRPRPYWRSIRSYWYLVVIALLIVLQWLAYPPVLLPPTRPSGEQVLSEGVHDVVRVVDGDTLLLPAGVRVRLQGIDTPETVRENYPVEPWGPESTQFTKNFVDMADGKLKLTFGSERLDDHGRYLAFAWHNDRLLNEELVRAGLARARLGYRFSSTMKRRLRLAQEEAQRKGRGIWSDEPPQSPTKSL